jgi:hypothetical protein
MVWIVPLGRIDGWLLLSKRLNEPSEEETRSTLLYGQQSQEENECHRASAVVNPLPAERRNDVGSVHGSDGQANSGAGIPEDDDPDALLFVEYVLNAASNDDGWSSRCQTCDETANGSGNRGTAGSNENAEDTEGDGRGQIGETATYKFGEWRDEVSSNGLAQLVPGERQG